MHLGCCGICFGIAAGHGINRVNGASQRQPVAVRSTILGTAFAVLATVGLNVRALAQETPAEPATTEPASAIPTPTPTPTPLPESVDGFRQELTDPNTPDLRRRRLAARAVLAGSPEHLEMAAGLLASEDPASLSAKRVIVAAAAQMEPPPPELLEPLVGLLAAETPTELLRPVARAIGGYDAPAAFAALSQAAAASNVAGLRAAAAHGLARQRSRASLALLQTLTARTQPAAVKSAAASSLAELTGAPVAADDYEAWRGVASDWLALEEAALAARFAEAADVSAQRARARAASSSDALVRLARQQYRNADPADRTWVMSEYITDPSPELRAFGIRLALDAISFGEPIDGPIMALIRDEVQDSSPEVRVIAARVVGARSDLVALPELLEQLPIDPASAARLAQIDALVTIRDPRAVPVLLNRMESDPSPSVRQRAARAASSIAVAAGDATLMTRVAARLRGRLAAVTGEAERVALLESLVPLREPSLIDLYRSLLRRGQGGSIEPATVRILALNGLTSLADRRAVDLVIPSLGDSDPAVRRAAVQALAATGGFASAAQLERFFNPSVEPDPDVRQAAWQGFAAQVPSASDRALREWAERLSDPERKLVVLRELARRAESEGNEEMLAYRRHEIAYVLDYGLDRPAEAAPLYEQALLSELDRQDAAGGGNSASVEAVGRAGDALRAYLRANRLGEAAALAATLVERRPGLREKVGETVKRVAAQRAESGDVAGARELIQAALEWEPPLDPLIQRNLRDMLESL